MSVGFIWPDRNKPEQFPFRKEALHPPTNTCAPGKPGRANDRKRLAARIEGWKVFKDTSAFHKPGSLKK